MKKIISTTLVALALVAVSTVDAKRMVPKGKKAMPVSTSTIVAAAKNALEGEGSGKDVINTIKDQAQTDAELETATLIAREAELKNKQEVIRQEMKDLNYGFFGFRTSKETQEKYRAATDDLKKNQADLNKVRADMNANKKETGMSWYNAVKYGVLAATVLGVSAAAIYDMYYQSGKGMKAIGTNIKTRAHQMSESVRGGLSGTYNRMRGTTGEVGK